MSKAKMRSEFVNNLLGACLLSRWHSALRWREYDSGSNMELQELVMLMIKENLKRQNLKRKSTDGAYKGGVTRSSDEVAVMAMERRGYVKRSN